MTAGRSERPDVLLVVLDCMRTDLFEQEVAKPEAMPFLNRLRSEVLEFPGAVSPGNWTIPGHASLFTGLYPWDHGAHNRLGPILTTGPETLAEFLAREGYGTSFYSANAYVQSDTGLTRGFEEAAWGSAREMFLRFLSIQSPSSPRLGGTASAWLPAGQGQSPMAKLGYFGLTAFSWAPGVWDGMNRIGGKVLGTYARDMRAVSPWIERRLDRWLSTQPKDRPVFSFVNLIEAHQPYLAEGGFPVGLADWLGYASRSQDGVRWLRGQWRPSARQIAELKEAFVRSLHTQDQRLRKLIEVFSTRRDWQNTLFVLTSDHGHAFLEGELLYHRVGLDETIARIPMWIRTPGASQRGRRSGEWASLIDIPRTVAQQLGRGSFGDPSARDLLAVPARPDPRPVFCMTDGMAENEVPDIPPERRRRLNWLGVAAYQGGAKAVVGEDHPLTVFGVSPDAAPATPALAPPGAESAAVGTVATETYEKVRQRISSREFHGTVERRLAGWGY